MRQDPEDIRKSHMQMVLKGLILNLLVPGILVGAGVALRKIMGSGDVDQIIKSDRDLQFFLYALMFVALMVVPIVFFLKKKLLKPLDLAAGSESTTVPTTSQIATKYTILYYLSMAASIWGFIYYLLGGQFQYFILFALISLITFRLIRPSAEFYYSLYGERSEDGGGL